MNSLVYKLERRHPLAISGYSPALSDVLIVKLNG